MQFLKAFGITSPIKLEFHLGIQCQLNFADFYNENCQGSKSNL